MAFIYNSCQNISSTVEFNKTRAFLYNSWQNCAILLYHNNLSRALPENENFKKNTLIDIDQIHFQSGC
jgi:hypothetical protein